MRKFLLALVALVGLTTAGAIANYTMTQGSGTTFGSVVIGGTTHYVQMLLCDLTTPAQCASVSAGGAVKVDGSAVTQPVSGTVTANVGTGTRPISIASAQVASGAYASGSFSSGAFASGSYASGAFAAGSMVDLLTMRGTVAGGTAASNSILTGCVYNSTPITLTNGQGSATQCSANGYPTVVVSNTLAAVTPGDGITTTVYGTAPASPVIGVPLLWNGTTYDRSRAGTTTGSTLINGAGTAGSASGGILTVQGVASMTPFLTNPGTAANWGIGATAAAVPANATYMGFNSGGNLTGASASTPLPVNNTGPYPIGSTPYTATATGTTAATTATLAGASSVTTYICGFSIRANATAAATGNATVTGTITATLNYTQWTAPNASGVGVVEQIFSPCIPASGTNQSIAVVSAAPGTGGVVSVTAWGYKL